MPDVEHGVRCNNCGHVYQMTMETAKRFHCDCLNWKFDYSEIIISSKSEYNVLVETSKSSQELYLLLKEIYNWTDHKSTPWAIKTKQALTKFEKMKGNQNV